MEVEMNDKVALNVMIDPEVKRLLRLLADINRRSMTAQLETLVMQASEKIEEREVAKEQS